MKSEYSIIYGNKFKIQIMWPHISYNTFGWGLFLKTCIVIGSDTFALTILGFGFGISGCRGQKWVLNTNADLVFNKPTTNGGV